MTKNTKVLKLFNKINIFFKLKSKLNFKINKTYTILYTVSTKIIKTK